MQKKILLIEDDDLIRDLYKTELETAGYSIDGYATGKEVLDALGKNSYDLVLLDIMLMDTNGLIVLKAIKANDATKDIRVIMLTNLGQDKIIKSAFELGAEGYLMKLHMTPEDLVKEVKNALQ
jgi:two-component system alkaline phosphatase synthesis response regulator PhoP